MAYQDDKVVVDDSVHQTIIDETIKEMVKDGSDIAVTIRKNIVKHLGLKGLTGDLVYNIKHEVIANYPTAKPTVTEEDPKPKAKRIKE